MKVKELKRLIGDLPGDMEVILQKDEEGNGYSPLCHADSGAVYIPTESWSGEIYFLSWSAEDAGMNEDAWEATKKKPRVLVLCPLN